MYSDDIRLSENFVSGDECRAHFSRAVDCRILTPGDHLHTEGVANLCHCTADVAETQHTERPPGNVITDRLLPSAATQRSSGSCSVFDHGRVASPGHWGAERRNERLSEFAAEFVRAMPPPAMRAIMSFMS